MCVCVCRLLLLASSYVYIFPCDKWFRFFITSLAYNQLFFMNVMNTNQATASLYLNRKKNVSTNYLQVYYTLFFFCLWLAAVHRHRQTNVIVRISIGNFQSDVSVCSPLYIYAPAHCSTSASIVWQSNNKRNQPLLFFLLFFFLLTFRFYWTRLNSIVIAIVWHSRMDVSFAPFSQHHCT